MKYQLVDKFLGYVTKPDATNTDGRYLVSGSKNVLINDGEKVESRQGYSLFGAEDATFAPIDASYEWLTSSATELPLRAGNSLLQVYFNGSWETLKSSLTSTNLVFTTWWNNSRKYDELVYVDGSDDTFYWTGGTALYVSATSNSITVSADITRFSTSGTLRIKDSGGTWRTFTYSSYTGAVFTVTTDPTVYTYSTSAPILEDVLSLSNNPASGFNNNFVFTSGNHLVFGSNTSHLIYISKTTAKNDFSFSSPRVAGEGEVLTLDTYGVGGADIEGTMFISAGKSEWYKIAFEQLTVGTTLSETISVKKLKTGAGQGALSHDLITTIGNAIVFVSNEPALRTLGFQENYPDVQMQSLSNPIKPDFDNADFTDGHIKSHKNRIYISAPADSIVYINEVSEDEQGRQRRFWQPPQVFPVQRFAIISDTLYGHSNATPETVKLFDTYSDLENNIDCIAKFAYRNFGSRTDYKVFSRYYSEGYLQSNTELTLTLNYDFGGAAQQVEKTILGTDSDLLFVPDVSNALGDNPLGDVPIGQLNETIDFPKFRTTHQLANRDFFELQTIYSSNNVDQRWQILAHGPNAIQSKNSPTKISR